ncbi:hypothetical protein ACFVKB_17370 [Rhodococcus sp. NPDC127530]
MTGRIPTPASPLAIDITDNGRTLYVTDFPALRIHPAPAAT